jgi:RNA polymerase sigma factor (sigma-70 family)
MREEDGSITAWIDQLKSGDRDAAARLWERYAERLLAAARERLPLPFRRALDEEDLALSAFDSFIRGGERGQFTRLEDRDDLWQLLMLITVRKVKDALGHERRQKRGGGRVLDEAALDALAESGKAPARLEGFVGREPPPDLAVAFADQLEQLLSRLDDDRMRQVLLHRLDDHTEVEISRLMGVSERTVRRKLKLIRQILMRESEA